MATIKSISKLVVDGDWIESKDQSPEGIRLVQTGNIGIGEYLDKPNRAKHISEETFERLNCTALTCGDILVSRLPEPIGRACIVPSSIGRAITAVDCTIIRLDPEKCDTEYFVQYTQSELYLNRLSQFFAGSTRTRISRKNLEQIDIPLPNIAEQRHIASILEKVDKLISLRKQQLAKLDELVKARFVELFGDPVENPYGWEQTTLKNIAIGKLSYGSGASACEYDGNIRYVRITDIDNSGRLNNDVVSPSVIDEKYILNDGDILFARSGATVGKSYRYRECDGKCLYAGYLIRLVPNTELVLPDYVFYYTKTSYYESFIASNMKVVAQPNINAQQYGDLTICIPPMELQKDFLSFVKQTDKSKLTIQQSLDKLETLKKSLMQKYFG